MDTLVALQQKTIALNWYGGQGKQNFMRNVPSLWQAGCDSLHSVGFVDVKDPTTLYTNEFLDKL
jgi:hypothetical protein